MKQFIFFTVISILLFSCNVKPEPINYGSDACHFCEMTIVDRTHASQIVTSKGKPYKYDAIECMLRSIQDEFKDTEMAYLLVTDLNKPGTLIDATKASYLISDNLRSPMGANLSAFENMDAGKRAQQKFKGKTYSWLEIQSYIGAQN